VGVELDGEGMLPGQLEDALARRPRMVVLQPRAHNPTGVSMSVERAEHLAALIDASGAWVVEDDSAGAVAAAPPLSLGAWLPERTVHVRSFSKSHGPDLRLAAMSGPAAVLDAVRDRRLLGQGWTSRLLQAVLLDLLTRAGSRRQVADARAAYAGRRSAVRSALALRGLELPERDGLNLWLPVRDETSALVALAARGIGAAAGSPFATRPGAAPHLRVTVGLVADGVDELADALVAAAESTPGAGPA
jgi:DNA-binding transcriptional MocR family regulator